MPNRELPTKEGATRIFRWLIVVLFIVLTYNSFRTYQLLQQGTQTHAALCGFKADLEHRIADGEKFLRLTPAQIRAQYGPSFADIPKTTIRQSLINQKATDRSLSDLACR